MKGFVLAFVSLIVLGGVAVWGPDRAEAAFVYACTPVASVTVAGADRSPS